MFINWKKAALQLLKLPGNIRRSLQCDLSVWIETDRYSNLTKAISLMIPCKDQTEIDYYWEALTSGGGQESVCGWLKDRYGLSWQVCPENWAELNKRPGAFKKMMGMKKIIIADF